MNVGKLDFVDAQNFEPAKPRSRLSSLATCKVKVITKRKFVGSYSEY
jgi:hypothetical protein